MAAEKYPLVGIVMGSDSDLPIMATAGDILEEFEVPHEYGIKSAHRTPDRMSDFGRTAASRGLNVIIAGAGGSAHLPGMLASETRLPVLGVNIESSPDPLNAGFGSMLRMPEGVPLATMGKNMSAAKNAALLAIRILALNNPDLASKYDDWHSSQHTTVAKKDDLINEIGAKKYLQRMQAVKNGDAESLFTL